LGQAIAPSRLCQSARGKFAKKKAADKKLTDLTERHINRLAASACAWPDGLLGARCIGAETREKSEKEEQGLCTTRQREPAASIKD
jgi:hypothetical protein